jgi:hypothetical protein
MRGKFAFGQVALAALLITLGRLLYHSALGRILAHSAVFAQVDRIATLPLSGRRGAAGRPAKILRVYASGGDKLTHQDLTLASSIALLLPCPRCWP